MKLLKNHKDWYMDDSMMVVKISDSEKKKIQQRNSRKKQSLSAMVKQIKEKISKLIKPVSLRKND